MADAVILGLAAVATLAGMWLYATIGWAPPLVKR